MLSRGRGLSQSGWPGEAPTLSKGKTREGPVFHIYLELLALHQAQSAVCAGVGTGEHFRVRHPGRGWRECGRSGHRGPPGREEGSAGWRGNSVSDHRMQ